jgi:hypothetical protein
MEAAMGERFESRTGGAALSIPEYDRLEQFARERASYPALRAFAPAAFAQVSFPTRVSAEHELRRYADIMHENSSRKEWLDGYRCSRAERALIEQLRAGIADLTTSLFASPVEPFMCLFPPLPILRVIEAVRGARGDRPLTVLEIGPGSGYLGGYLTLRGHRYIGTDITQALYLWQHRLLRWLSAGEFEDFALHRSPPAILPEQRVSLLPWWHFAELYRRTPLPVDVIVCEAAMGEMDPFAVRYVIRLATRMLEKSDVGLFLYTHIGEERISRLDTIRHLFKVCGYRSLACGPVTVQGLSASAPFKLLDRMPAGPPPLDIQNDGEPLQPPSAFLTLDPDRILDSYAFFDFLKLSEG